jgi:uncharacterized C2H2 Zn-finger protein
MSVHLKRRDYHCDHCDKVFSQKANLNKHVNSVHKKLTRYQCDHRDKVFSRKCNLQTHVNSRHGPKKTQIPCLQMFALIKEAQKDEMVVLLVV